MNRNHEELEDVVTKSVDITKRIDALAALIPVFKKTVEADQVIELDDFHQQIDRLCQDILALPSQESEPLKPRLIALVDEIGLLETLIIERRATIESRLRNNEERRQATAAYHGQQTSSSRDS